MLAVYSCRARILAEAQKDSVHARRGIPEIAMVLLSSAGYLHVERYAIRSQLQGFGSARLKAGPHTVNPAESNPVGDHAVAQDPLRGKMNDRPTLPACRNGHTARHQQQKAKFRNERSYRQGNTRGRGLSIIILLLTSCNDVVDNMASHIGQAIVSTCVPVSKLGMVDPELM